MIRIATERDIHRIKNLDGEKVQEMSAAEKARLDAQDWYAKIVGTTLVKNYPEIQWKVTIRMGKTGGIAYIQVPAISSQFGMIVHLSDTALVLEEEAKAGGGELLERFGIARSGAKAQNDLLHLRRDVRGEAIGARKGEQK